MVLLADVPNLAQHGNQKGNQKGTQLIKLTAARSLLRPYYEKD